MEDPKIGWKEKTKISSTALSWKHKALFFTETDILKI